MQKTTLHRFKRALPASSTRSDLEGLVKDSSDKVRQFFFAYLALIAYVLAVVFATTDKQLLLVNEGLKLPIVDLTVPLIGFYVVIPLFVLGLHFNLLQNLASHHFKLMELQRAWKGTVPSERINASMFDFAVLEQNSVLMHWVRAANSLLCIYSGPIALSVVLWRFADYQSSWILFEHVALLWLDLYFVTQTQKSFAENDIVSVKLISRINNNKFSFHLIKNYIELIENFLYAPLIARPRNNWQFLWFNLIAVILLKILVCMTVFVYDWSNPLPKHFRALISDIDKEDWLIPKLHIDATELLFIADTKKIETQAVLLGEKDLNSYIDKYSYSLDLRGRSLRYLSLQKQILPKLLLQKSHLEGANLENAQLRGSNFEQANLRDVKWTGVNLQDSNLRFAQLSGSKLHSVQLQNANLYSANLQYADMLFLKAQGVNLSSANMQGAYLFGAQLQNADLSRAKLQGSNLSSAILYGANMNSANLQGADLLFTQFQGANLSNASLQGSSITSAKFQGANLKSAKLQGAWIDTTNFWGIESTTETISISTLKGNRNLQVFIAKQPTKDEIEEWGGAIINIESRKRFIKTMYAAMNNDSTMNLTFHQNDELATQAMLDIFCKKDSNNSGAAIAGMLQPGELKYIELEKDRQKFATLLKSKFECRNVADELEKALIKSRLKWLHPQNESYKTFFYYIFNSILGNKYAV